LLNDLSRATLGHGRDRSIVQKAGECASAAAPETATELEEISAIPDSNGQAATGNHQNKRGGDTTAPSRLGPRPFSGPGSGEHLNDYYTTNLNTLRDNSMRSLSIAVLLLGLVLAAYGLVNGIMAFGEVSKQQTRVDGALDAQRAFAAEMEDGAAGTSVDDLPFEDQILLEALSENVDLELDALRYWKGRARNYLVALVFGLMCTLAGAILLRKRRHSSENTQQE